MTRLSTLFESSLDGDPSSLFVALTRNLHSLRASSNDDFHEGPTETPSVDDASTAEAAEYVAATSESTESRACEDEDCRMLPAHILGGISGSREIVTSPASNEDLEEVNENVLPFTFFLPDVRYQRFVREVCPGDKLFCQLRSKLERSTHGTHDVLVIGWKKKGAYIRLWDLDITGKLPAYKVPEEYSRTGSHGTLISLEVENSERLASQRIVDLTLESRIDPRRLGYFRDSSDISRAFRLDLLGKGELDYHSHLKEPHVMENFARADVLRRCLRLPGICTSFLDEVSVRNGVDIRRGMRDRQDELAAVAAAIKEARDATSDEEGVELLTAAMEKGSIHPDLLCARGIL